MLTYVNYCMMTLHLVMKTCKYLHLSTYAYMYIYIYTPHKLCMEIRWDLLHCKYIL